MAATITFYAGTNQIQDLSGSGLGFYGDSGFGASVSVGAWQGRTYITDSAGANQGAEVWNIKWANSQSGVIGQAGSGINIKNIPNYQATLNLRATFDSPVKVQSCQVRIWDRSSINNPPSGVVAMVAELIHPSTSQAVSGSGNSTWTQAQGSGTILNLSQSPGTSGHYASSSSLVVDSQHDFYLAISASPSVIGSRLFSLYGYVEYL